MEVLAREGLRIVIGTPTAAPPAWQIDNEFGCHGTTCCHCPRCEAAFRAWLRDRYGRARA